MYRLPAEVRAAAVKCPRGVCCVDSGRCGGAPLCEVSYADGANVLFLADEGGMDCPYRLQYGTGQVCSCPVRFAIHRRYGA